MKYFFIFGIHPSLSVAELLQYFLLKKIEYKILSAGSDFLIVETIEQINLAEIQKKLGGLVKSGQIIGENFIKIPSADELLDGLQEFIKTGKKFFCGFSFYPSYKKQYSKILFRLGLELKKNLKQQKISTRIVSSKETNLSSVTVAKNKLLSDRGAEVVFMQDYDVKKIFMGRTATVQDFANLSFRDYSRPARDDYSGMIPPKLAQIMINLSGSDYMEKVLDPFCGSGTILQEALLIGYRKVIGFDSSAKAICDTKENLVWLKNKFEVNIDKVLIFESNVEVLADRIDIGSIGAIVTEPDLGTVKLNKKNVLTEKKRLEDLYVKAYGQFVEVLKKRARVVMVWPVFFTEYYLDIESTIKNFGFKKINILSDDLQKVYKLNDRKNLYYGRTGQKVTREVTVWEKI